MSRLALLFSATLILAPAFDAGAQDRSPLSTLRQNPRQSGLTPESLNRIFATATATPGFGDIRDDIQSFQIYFDPALDARRQARAEVRLLAADRQTSLELPLEFGPVVFKDTGEGLDRVRGDGTFTAAVPFALNAFVAEHFQSADGLRTSITNLQRAPRFDGRDLVRSREPSAEIRALSDERTRARIEVFARLDEGASRLGGPDLVKALGLDPAQDPVLEVIRRERVPGSAFESRFAGLPASIFGTVQPSDIDPMRSLMIVDTKFVEDPDRTFDVCTGAGTKGGVWTFAHLMREMAKGSGRTPEEFTQLWLNNWILPQAVNGQTVIDPARASAIKTRIIDPWLALSGGTPNIDLFPARLMAIVNRPDLADAIGYGAVGSGGEARFVFGLLQKSASGCAEIPFTVIFEYGISAKSCSALKNWQTEWHKLNELTIGSAAYNKALADITVKFTDHGTNPNQLPNQNSLAQLRTNEFELGPEWELREFTLQGQASATPGELALVTVKQTPKISLNNTTTLTSYIALNTADILASKHKIPTRFPTLLDPFLGAVSPVPNPSFVWDAPGVGLLTNGFELRHKLSLATCSGCHAGETNTFFTHIGTRGTRAVGAQAELSGFLTGIAVQDPRNPATPPVEHNFNDLELRRQKMANILGQSCFILPFVHRPLRMVH